MKPVTLLKVTLLHGCFSRFQNCTNCTKSSKASHMFSVTLSHASNKWKSFNHEISHVKEKLDPQNTHEILDPQNTDENNFGPTKYPREKILGSRNKYPWEKFGPAKYLREKISDPRNTHERHDGIRIARSTMTGDPKKPQHTRFCSRNIKFYLTSWTCENDVSTIIPGYYCTCNTSC